MLNIESGLLLLFGIAIFGGISTALLFRKMKMPQVIGYIVAGIVIGQSGFKLISLDHVLALNPFNYFALGIIGFLVGCEIRFEDLKKYRKQFSLILFAEGMLAFILVTAAITAIVYQVTGSIEIALACGVVFGAIASATDPASTINVIWEYRAAGVLTTTVIAIVALDDALAMFLYGVGTSLSQMLTGQSSDVGGELLRIALHLLFSTSLGVICGLLITLIVKRASKSDTVFVCVLSLLLSCVGLSVVFDLDIILAAMFAGIIAINAGGDLSKGMVDQIRSISSPVYILFFVLVGARLSLEAMPLWMWGIISAYVLLRSFGKFAGSWIGAKLSGADKVVANYTGISLFAQGGVAIGLSIMASQHLTHIMVTESLSLGDVIIFGVTTTTLLVQLIGPVMVKLAITLAKETGKNIDVEDVIAKWTVGDRIDLNAKSVPASATLREVVARFTQIDEMFLAVVNADRKFLGIISYNEIKSVIMDQQVWDWLIAADVLTKTRHHVYVSQPLSEALILMEQLHLEQLPVIDLASGRWIGMIDRMKVMKSAQKELLTCSIE